MNIKIGQSRLRKSAPKTVKVLLSAGYSTNPSDSVNLRRNSSAERAAHRPVGVEARHAAGQRGGRVLLQDAEKGIDEREELWDEG